MLISKCEVRMEHIVNAIRLTLYASIEGHREFDSFENNSILIALKKRSDYFHIQVISQGHIVDNC